MRFGELLITRDSERVPVSVSDRNKRAKIYDYYGASGIIDKIDDYLFDDELLLIGEDGANLLSRSTPIAFIAKGKYWVNNHAHVLDACCNLNLNYICYHINAISLAPYVTGTAQPKMNQENMNAIWIALPPLEEQHRIVAKIEELLPYVDRSAVAYEKLEQFNTKFPENMKKSILRYAIQGKLVEQRAEEGTGEELYQQIQAEKQRLIQEKKIKKEKPLAEISEDEIPFDIPESWKWARFSSVIELQSGQDMTPDKYNANHVGIPYITGASNITNGDVLINRWTECGKAFAYKGDVLFTCKGTVGTMAVLQEPKVHIARQIMAIRPIGSISVYYIQVVLDTLVSSLKAAAKSIIPGIAREDILTSLIPLPPLAEQKRIVAKIEELLPLCDRLRK